MKLSAYLNEFTEKISKGSIEIYNEPSVQHELAICLRARLGDRYKIQLERNIRYFDLDPDCFEKKEMDLVLFTEDKKEKHCIEVKFPRHCQGQVPEQMFKACIDVRFLEQLKKAGFAGCYFLMVTDEPLFYTDKCYDGIYKIFRNDRAIKGQVKKPTGKQDKVLNFEGEYKIEWHPLRGELKFFTIEVMEQEDVVNKIKALDNIFGMYDELTPKQQKIFAEATKKRPFFG